MKREKENYKLCLDGCVKKEEVSHLNLIKLNFNGGGGGE